VEDEILASAKVSETMTVENERQQHVSKREEYVAVATEEKQLRFGRFCFPFISFVFGLILILLYCWRGGAGLGLRGSLEFLILFC